MKSPDFLKISIDFENNIIYNQYYFVKNNYSI